MAYSNNCPVCGKPALGIETNKTRNTITKAGAKSILKYGGKALGGIVGSFFGVPELGSDIFGKLGSMAGGEIADKMKRFAYSCSCCNIEWFSDDSSRAQIIRRHYDRIYNEQCKPLPKKPDMSDASFGVSISFIGILIILLFPYWGLVFLWSMAFFFYLMTFTLLDLMQYVNDWIVDFFKYSWELYAWVLGAYLLVYLFVLIRFKMQMRAYNKEMIEVKVYNIKLRKRLDKECNDILSQL